VKEALIKLGLCKFYAQEIGPDDKVNFMPTLSCHKNAYILHLEDVIPTVAMVMEFDFVQLWKALISILEPMCNLRCIMCDSTICKKLDWCFAAFEVLRDV
jgi:hypothetical protein